MQSNVKLQTQHPVTILLAIALLIGPIAAVATAQFGGPDRLAEGDNFPDGLASQAAWIQMLPIAGVPGEDFYLGPFFDNDPAPGAVLDYMDKERTYDGHRGTDFGLLGFAEMEIGVPVLAVLDGVVAAVVDGFEDHQTTNRQWRPGNYVTIHHDHGKATYYGHLQRDSLSVKVGQRVVTGQQIARVGSSGNSSGPHLHFECVENRRRIDPFSGPANDIQSRWISQPEYRHPMKVVDAGISAQKTQRPMQITRAAFVRTDASWLEFWTVTMNQTAGHVVRWELVKPDGQIHTSGSEEVATESEVQHRWWWSDTPGLSRGRWTFRVYHDRQLAAAFPVQVLDARSASPRNRPPQRPRAVLWPKTPLPAEVVGCRVEFADFAADPDLDRLRYRYVWSIDGQTKRDALTAVHADYLPAAVGKPGDVLECQVFASDGKLSSRPLTLSLTYREPNGEI